MELILKESKNENELLDKQLKEQDNKLKETISQPQASNKEQLLENEIKYFKQQIEILINEHKNFANLIEEKEHLVNNLNKELKTYEQDREQHSKLLDQVHNDKQTLSRAIQQNKDLKDQLVELQDAFVNVTKQNLDLATKLESENFKIKQPTETVKPTSDSAVLGDDWEEDNSDNQESTPNHNDNNNKSSLMNGVKERLIELEKENKDLNDYITLMDENLKRNNDQQLSTINSQLKEINSLNETIKEINVERCNLKQQLNASLNNSSKTDNNNNGNNSSLEFNETNFKNLLLLEVNHFKNFNLIIKIS